MKFVDLGLNEKLLQAIEECGYDTPTPIQAQAIPHILMNRDVVGLAQTGTGKTGAFTLPMIEILEGGRAKARMPRSLILSPTRELAAQIAENFDIYGKYGKLEKALLVGGVSMDKQVKKLDRGVDVLIATPGRMLDLFERGQILLNDIKVLVIDEADRMLDMGFIPDIEKIVSLLSPMRQTLLFSATMPPEISRLTKKFLSNPREVSVDAPASTAVNVKQFLVWTDQRKKMDVLEKIISNEEVKTAFIFCNRKRDIGGLNKFLKSKGYNSDELHGDMAQSDRQKTLARFKDGKIDLLVCSDVAGRGIDVDHISHVFNYDVPMHADDYVHRVGRTGRAGREGRAFTLATKREEEFVDKVKKLIKMDLEEPEISLSGPSSSRRGDGSKPTRTARKTQSKTNPKANLKPKSSSSSKHAAGASRRSEAKNSKDHANHNDEVKDDVQGFGDDVPSFFG